MRPGSTLKLQMLMHTGRQWVQLQQLGDSSLLQAVRRLPLRAFRGPAQPGSCGCTCQAPECWELSGAAHADWHWQTLCAAAPAQL